MYVLAMLAIVALVAARAVPLRRRGRLALAAAVGTVALVGIFMLPELLASPRPSPLDAGAAASIGRGFALLFAMIVGTGFLVLGAVATRRARRDAATDAERVLADAVVGTAAWVVGATVAGVVLMLLLFSTIGMMAP